MARDFSNDPEAEMEKLTARMVQLNRQFNETFERCFERPELLREDFFNRFQRDGRGQRFEFSKILAQDR